MQRSCNLEQARRPHASADTHGDNGILLASALGLDEGMAHQAHTRHCMGGPMDIPPSLTLRRCGST